VAVDADVLVTRDEDLLTLQRHGQTEIIHVAAFLARIAASPE
jgi:predicted nucleic acid-binding protein